jgi:O-antigen/teichoic acid export membrane protein
LIETKSSNKNEVLKVGLLSFVANILSKVFTVPIGIIIASILGPINYGILAIINLILQYLTYFNLGILTNITREVPIAYGANKLKEVKLVYDVTFTNYFIYTFFSVFLIWVLYYLKFLDDSLTFRIFILLTLLYFSKNLVSFFHTYMKGEGKFVNLAQNEIILKMGLPILSLFLVWLFNIEGMLISMLIINLISFLFVFKNLNKPSFSFNFNLKKTKELLSTSVFMHFNKIIDGVFISLGILFTSTFLSLEEVGLLSFAMVLATIDKVPFATSIVLMINRQMAILAGKEGENNYHAFKNFFGKNLSIYMLLTSTVLGMLVIFYSVLVKIFLIEFLDSLPIFIILFFSINFYNVRYFMYNYFNITLQMVKRSLILIVGLLINLVLCSLSIYFEFGIIGIAFSISFSFFIISLQVITITLDQVNSNKFIKLWFLLKLFIISIVLTSLVYYFSYNEFFEYNSDYKSLYNLSYILLDVSLKFLIFGSISLFIFCILFQNQKILQELIIYFKMSLKKIGFS